MKIIDGFIFYNELNMLEYRLSILDDVVDTFILVESTHTFAGNKKPLFFEDNKGRYAKWAHKIIHIVVDDFLYVAPAIDYSKNQQWENEYYQRNCIARGFERLNLGPQDVVMVSDLDEIPDPDLLKKVRSDQVQITCYAMGQVYHCYNLNTRSPVEWTLARIFAYRNYSGSCQAMRDTPYPVAHQAGWHLSYFGDASFIQNKILEFSHQELNTAEYTDLNYIQTKLDSSMNLYGREGLGIAYHNLKVAIEDNPYLPPKYQTYLAAFYKLRTAASP